MLWLHLHVTHFSPIWSSMGSLFAACFKEPHKFHNSWTGFKTAPARFAFAKMQELIIFRIEKGDSSSCGGDHSNVASPGLQEAYGAL
jgi:hypothetical protein